MAVNWGEVFSNVTKNLVEKLPDIGASVIKAVVANKLAPKIEKEKAAKEPSAPVSRSEGMPIVQTRQPASFMTSLPTWWPMAAGGVAIVVVGYFLYKGKRRSW